MNEFTAGDQATCRAPSGYFFTLGKVYTILQYDPPHTYPESPWFTWPAYVVVLDDLGKKVVAHAHRFVPTE